MNDAIVKQFQARAARHKSKHVKRFVPLIPICIRALDRAGIKWERRYRNQIKIKDRWIGRFEHLNQPWPRRGLSRLAIYDRTGREPVLEIKNADDAEFFARMIAFAKLATERN